MGNFQTTSFTVAFYRNHPAVIGYVNIRKGDPRKNAHIAQIRGISYEKRS